MASQIINRYGMRWVDKYDLEIELYMISKGGQWQDKGKTFGDGMFEHMMRARKLAWPTRYRHRWTDLIYKNVIENIVTVLMGPGSAGKTSHAAEIALLRYWARPHDSLCLVSTTTVDKLDMAVFGELKMLHREAQSIHPWLAGNVIDSKRAITTDILEDGETRDIRKGIVGRACFVGQRYVGLSHFAGIKQNQLTFLADECFPAGTLVDTPNGKKSIELVNVGDWVISATGSNRVKGCIQRTSHRLLRIMSMDGRQVVCTPEHPFLTQLGWIKACNLNASHFMLGAYEAMLVLQGNVQSSRKREGLSKMSGCVDGSMLQRLRKIISSEKNQGQEVVLQSELCESGALERSRIPKEILHRFKIQEDLGHPECLLHQTPGRKRAVNQRILGSFQKVQGIHDYRTKIVLEQANQRQQQSHRSKTEGEGRKRNWSIQGGMATVEDVSKCHMEPPCEDWNEGRKRISHLLQVGPGLAGSEIGNRSGWEQPFKLGQQKTERREETEVLGGSWVDCVKVEESGNTGFPMSDSDSSGCRVYNLEVDGHPSYSVNGFLVHNCQFMASTFFDCLPNMFQGCGLDNDNEPDIKVIPMGNPRHDPMDQLSIAAEPVPGWDSVKDVTTTSVWPTKFRRGVCVNLIGTDSPNFDVPEGVRPPYPRLINRQTCKIVEARWKPGTLQHNSQVVGKMIMGMLGNRVLTKKLCDEHHAFDKAVWLDTKITRLWFLDPAWGGHNADRCVWGWLEFGTELTGRQIMRVGGTEVVPIMGDGPSPDDQIAIFCKRHAMSNGIPLANGFYDSTGRGTVGAAFGRIMPGVVPVPVAFGDRPSKRPVRFDLFVIDEVTHVRRHKRCDEEYGKYVTELWFAVRNVVECDQMRELPEDVMNEGCMREYSELPGGKIDVETKDEMRDRIGHSPDLFDSLVVGVEGARQLGFRIDRLGYDILENQDNEEDFFDTEVKLYQDAINSQLLEH